MWEDRQPSGLCITRKRPEKEEDSTKDTGKHAVQCIQQVGAKHYNTAKSGVRIVFELALAPDKSPATT